MSASECRNSHSYGAIDELLPGEYSIQCRIEQNVLSPGLYVLNVGARCRPNVGLRAAGDDV